MVFQCVYPQTGEVSTRFTSFFSDESIGDFFPAFKELIGTNNFEDVITQHIEAELVKIKHLNFIPTRGTQQTVRQTGPNTIFIRGLVTRADLKIVEHFATEEYVYNTNVTMEFFDLASGEVYYTRTLTGQVFDEKSKGEGIAVTHHPHSVETKSQFCSS